jgi:purine nucleosidase
MDCIIYDCDNTFGLPGRPADDGLALLYLLGKFAGAGRARFLGVTTTYGNAEVCVTYENTKRLLRKLGRSDIPVWKGGASCARGQSEASVFLAEQAALHAGRLVILATGALTNLFAACERDPHFFDNVSEIVLMGGITEPLFLGGVKLDELNFSCDPEASRCVLTRGKNISILTGNNCLAAYIRRADYENRLTCAANPIGRYIKERTSSWFDAKRELYGLDGFYAWDAAAAVYALEKGLFADRPHRCDISLADLRRGFIGKGAEADDARATILNLPVIRDRAAFQEELYAAWLRVDAL